MRTIFSKNGGCRVWYAFLTLIFVMAVFSMTMLYESDENSYFDNTAIESRNRNNVYMENCSSTPNVFSITLFVRMAGKLKQHRTRFYCDFLRTSVLFWPASFGKTVVVLDEESEQDHIFAKKLTSHSRGANSRKGLIYGVGSTHPTEKV